MAENNNLCASKVLPTLFNAIVSTLLENRLCIFNIEVFYNQINKH